jgi:hypothetical protein
MDYKKQIINLSYCLGAILFMYSIFKIITYYDEQEHNNLMKNGLQTIGKVTPRMGVVKVHYSINKEKLSNFNNSPFSGIEEGETFFMKVDERNSSNIFVEFYKPVLYKKDSIYFRNTKAISLKGDLFDNRDIIFNYFVENKQYKRFQIIPKNVQRNRLLAKQNEVIYDIRNPHIAYLKSFVYFVN